MQSIQLACPHCKSALSFGQAPAPGSVLSCLICNRPFKVPGTTPAAAAVAPAAQPAAAAAAPPVATAPTPRPAAAPTPAVPAAAAPKTSSKNGRTAPAAAPPKPARQRVAAPPDAPRATSRASAGLLGGVALVGILLLMISGLAYLFWTNVLADRLADTQKKPAPDAPVVAQGPTSQLEPDKDGPGPSKDGGTPVEYPPKKDGNVPAKSEEPATKDGEVDIADVKKKEQPTPMPVLPNPIKSVDPDPPVKPPPMVDVKVTPPEPAPGYEVARVNAAIDKGVQYLRKWQQQDGGWFYFHRVGLTGLAGLTLLECQVPAKDPAVQNAAKFVRQSLGSLTKTYEISCALLFLDRLNDPDDRVLVQALALRLLAGQNYSGGWSYDCPALSVQDMRTLFTYLQSHRPVPAPPRKDKKARGDITDSPVPQRGGYLQAQAPGPGGIMPGPPGGFMPMGDLMARPLRVKPQVPNPITTPYRPDGKAWPPLEGKRPQAISASQLPGNLQGLPIVRTCTNKGWFTAEQAGGDHSNTQFALLALWAARRHDVPSEYALLLSYQRFKLLQAADGGWAYMSEGPSTNTMMCAGLLGLTLGYGAVPAVDNKNKVEEPAIQKGLQALGAHIGTAPNDVNAKVPPPNLYFLWSVERVAVLYDLKTIGGQDWYRWGAQSLLVNQGADGGWMCGPPAQYTGEFPAVDTCFALLFLKRANLVADLTENIRLFMVIRDPGAR